MRWILVWIRPRSVAARSEVVGSRIVRLWDALCRAYQMLGFYDAGGGDEVFGDLVLARIIEPTSKADSFRVLAEAGVDPMPYRPVKRRLPVIAKHVVRQALSAACARHTRLGPATQLWIGSSNSKPKYPTATSHLT
jgi:hypothetical protein